MTDIHTQKGIIDMLLELADTDYKIFSQKLVPNIEKDSVIGIRVPQLRALAKRIRGTKAAESFLSELPHTYFEENHLHAFLVSEEKDFSKALSETERFLPYIDNWATCDSFIPKAFARLSDAEADILYGKALEWMGSTHEYTVRFGIAILMRYFLDERFEPHMPKIVASVRSDKYYVNMMCAWYLATALAKQYDSTIGCLESRIPDVWVHNKTISKACESFRIDNITKEYLRSLKRK